MREILFRGKRVDNGEWAYGSLIIETNPFDKDMVMTHIYDNFYNEIIVDPRTIGQYTGLCDRNGTRIFEGDIVKGVSEYFGNGSLNQKAVVLYDKGQFLLSFGDTLTECNQFKDVEVLGAWHDDIEVIGNIHDNLAELEMIE